MFLPDVRLQNAALTLAQELNFTRASERLGITQPALSKRISELEVVLGFEVFHRMQRRTELTEAGHVFIRGCQDSQSILERSIRSAKATREEVQPVIAFGHSPYADPNLIAAVLGIHLPLHSNLRLRVESMFAPELARAVTVSELDMALISDPLENPLLTQVEIATDPLCVVMQSEHPAAAKGTVVIRDFQNVGWMLFPRRAHPGIYDRLMEEARVAGVSPIELHHYVSTQELTPLTSENFGVAFAAKGISEQIRGAGVAVRPLSHASLRVTTKLVLRADQSSKLVNDFCRDLLRKTLDQAELGQGFRQLKLGL